MGFFLTLSFIDLLLSFTDLFSLSQHLPTSLTCFGRLLLPEYSSQAVLEEKLGKALENARGFGVA